MLSKHQKHIRNIYRLEYYVSVRVCVKADQNTIYYRKRQENTAIYDEFMPDLDSYETLMRELPCKQVNLVF